MRRKCKTTYLSTNCKKPDSVVFKESFFLHYYICITQMFNLIKEIHSQKGYRCHHNTRPKKNSVPRPKHLSCVATLIIQIEHEFDEMKINIIPILCYRPGV